MATTPNPRVIRTMTPDTTIAVTGALAAERAEPRIRVSIRGATAEVVADLSRAQASELRTMLEVEMLGVGGGYLR